MKVLKGTAIIFGLFVVFSYATNSRSDKIAPGPTWGATGAPEYQYVPVASPTTSSTPGGKTLRQEATTLAAYSLQFSEVTGATEDGKYTYGEAHQMLDALALLLSDETMGPTMSEGKDLLFMTISGTAQAYGHRADGETSRALAEVHEANIYADRFIAWFKPYMAAMSK